MQKLFPEKPKEAGLNPDKIISILFYLHDAAHLKHLQTTMFAEHKALDILYNELVTFKDEIGEMLLGYIAPKRFNFQSIPVKDIHHDALVAQVLKFADDLYNYAEANKWWALSNKAQDLSGLALKIKYLLTLS